MSETKHELSIQLAQARHQLKLAQAQVTELEARIAENNPEPIMPLAEDDLRYPVLDALQEGFQIIGFDWRYLYVNEMAARHGHRAKEDLLGHTMMEMYPGIDQTGMFATLQKCMKERTIEQMENEFNYPDGTRAWFELRIQPVPEGIVILSLEITRRKQNEAELLASEQAINRYAQRMKLLHEIDTGIIEARTTDEVLISTLKHIRELIPCQLGGVILFDAENDEAQFFAIDADSPTDALPGTRRPMPPADWLESFGPDNLKLINDLANLVEPLPFQMNIINQGMHSILHVLLRAEGQSIGLFNLMADRPDFFTKEYQQIAVEVANQIAIAVHYLRLNEKLAHQMQTVDETREFLETTFNAIPANTTVLDPDGTIVTVNLPWKQFYDANDAHTTSYFVGDNYLSVCDAANGPFSEEALMAADGIRAVIAGHLDDFYLEYPCHSPDEERWFMLRVTPFIEAVPRRVVVAHVDITVRKQAEKSAHEQRHLADALRESLVVLTASLDVETVMQQILDYSGIVIPSEAGTIILYDGDHGRVAYSRGYSAEAQAFFKDVLIPIDTGVLAVDPQGNYLASDTRKTSGWLSFESTKWVRSSIGVPILLRGESIGLLIVDSATPNRFQKEDVENLQTFARYAALALENAHQVRRLEEKVQERTSQLQTAKDRVEDILNNSPDGILLVRANLTINQANTAFDRLFDSEDNVYFGQNLTDLFEPASAEQVLSRLHAGKSTGQVINLEARARRRDDTAFDAELSVGFLGEGDLVCSIRDISERKEQERQLRYHASLQQNVSDAVIVTDMAYRVQSWNRAAERIYGWQAEEVMGNSVAEFLRTEFFSDDDAETSARVLHEQGWWQGEIIQHHRDGNSRHILSSVTMVKDEHGASFGIVAVNHDITMRKEADEKLRESEARFRQIAENIDQVLFIRSADNQDMLYINPVYETMWGKSRESLYENPNSFLENVFPEDIDKVRQQLTSSTYLQTGLSDFEYRYTAPDEEIRWVRVRTFPIKDNDGVIVRRAGIIEDITEHKEYERELHYHASLQQNVNDAVIVTDLDFRIQSWNQAAERIYGWRADEVINKTTMEVLQTQFSQEDTHEKRKQHLLEKGWWRGEATQLSKAGNIIHILSSVAIVRDENDFPYGAVAINHDFTERKLAQEALQQYAAEVHDLYNNAPCGYHSLDKDGVIVQINNTELEWLGYERDEVIGKLKFSDVITPESQTIFQQSFPKFRDQGWISDLEFDLLTKDGNIISVLLNATAVKNDTGEFVRSRSTLFDISDRKRAIRALQESEGRFRLLVEAAPVAIVISDSTGRVLLVNNRAEQLLGYGRDELIDQSIDLLVPETLREGHAQHRANYMADLRMRPMGSGLELQARRKNGTYFPVEIELSYIEAERQTMVMSFIDDITERKRAETALKESEEKFRTLIETMRGGLAIWDIDDHLTYVNDRFCEIVGYSSEEIIGKALYDFLAETNVEQVKSRFTQQQQIRISPYEIDILHKSGRPVHLLVSGSPLLNTDEQFDGVVAIVTDISTQKQAEGRLRLALDKEKELGELKTRFVSMASHEFRTPLATILALTDTLSAYRHKLSEDQIDQRFDKIKVQIAHLKDIMEDVLLLARMQARRIVFNPVQTNLDDLCRSVIDEFQSLPDVGHSIEYFCNTALHEVLLDKTLMRQIINNLVSNAIKYSLENSPVKVTLDYDQKFMILQVSDNGIGIPESDLEHLFEPFHRATNVGTISGTGLGLVITRESVELHGGIITVESQVDEGTTFTVRIPASVEGGNDHGQSPGD